MDNGNATGIFHIPLYDAKIESFDFDTVVNAVDEWQPNDGGNSISKDKYILNHPDLKEVKEECEYHLNRFLTNVVKINLKFHITQSWVNKNQKGSWHAEHIHRNSVWNAVMFMNYHPTPMQFRDPNPWKDYYDFSEEIIESNWANSNIADVYPEVGKLIIFPHYLYHGVGKNPIDEERYSLAFNTWFSQDFGKEQSLTRVIHERN
jgi:uncharacterized protein (TIGR02466 family)